MGDPRRYIYSIGMHHGKHKTAQAGRQKTQYRGGSNAAIASMPCNRAGQPQERPSHSVLSIVVGGLRSRAASSGLSVRLCSSIALSLSVWRSAANA